MLNKVKDNIPQISPEAAEKRKEIKKILNSSPIDIVKLRHF
mgnify:CR=1 FL=1